MPLVEKSWFEHMNKLDEEEAFIDSVRLKKFREGSAQESRTSKLVAL